MFPESMKKDKKGVVVLYFIFLIVAIFIIFVAAFAAPMGVLFNTELYKAGEDIMLQANESISGIQNDTVRSQIQTVVSGGLAATQNNIEVNNALFQYGWIVVLVLAGLVIFLFTRSLVELQTGSRLV